MNEMETPGRPWHLAKTLATIALALAMLLGLYLLARNRQTYLLFHCLAQTFSVVVALSFFVVVWNARRFQVNSYLLFLGVTFLCVASLGLLHMLAYRTPGHAMGVFPAYDANLATQLWIAMRFILASAFLIAPFVINRKLNLNALLAATVAATAGLIALVFTNVFPDCFLPGRGITPFKIVSEYVIIAMLAGSILLLQLRRQAFAPSVRAMIRLAIVAVILSELFFTRYTTVDDFSNAAGHFLDILAFFLLYRAVIVTGLTRPYELIFRDLKASEDALRLSEARYRDLVNELEQRVQRRTQDLSQTLDALRAEVVARRELEAARLKLAEIVESSGDAILSESLDGIVLSWNRSAERLTGYTAAETIGQPVFNILPPDQHAAMRDILRRVAEGERLENVETTRFRKNGQPVSISATYSPLRDVSGNITGMAAMIRDMSEHRRLEEQVLLIGENERQRIGHDLHDALGQHLTGTTFLCKVLQQKLAKRQAPEAEDASAIEQLLSDAVALTRDLARGLSPIGLKDDSLMVGLKNLSIAIAEMHHVACEFKCDRPILVRNLNIGSHLYHIAQEAASNAVKHGHARHVQIELKVRDRVTELSVRDDGTGIPKLLPPTAGMGLRIMGYRANAIGGAITIQPGQDGGTIVHCTVRTDDILDAQDARDPEQSTTVVENP